MSLINRINAELRGDRVIWTIVAILALFSILAVYSSAGSLAFKERGGNTEYFLIKQIVILALGLGLTYLAYLTPYWRYKNLAPYLLAVAVPLLFLTQLFGPEVNNARRWLVIPFLNISFQTSDYAKLALVIYVAKTISAKQEIIKDFKSAFVPIIVPIIIICLLIAPSNLSTAAMLFGICFLMMFIGRVDIKYLGLLIFSGMVAFAGLIVVGQAFPKFIRVETWIKRIRSFREGVATNEFSQVAQSKIAIAKGGVFGMGPGNSTQRNFLPSPYTDYVYSIIIEEYGLIGGCIITGLYVLLFMRCVRLVTISPRTFGALLAVGISLLLVIQALANMAVAVDLMPVTGLPMPIVSMGGTSLLFSCLQFGILLSVSKFIETANANA